MSINVQGVAECLFRCEAIPQNTFIPIEWNSSETVVCSGLEADEHGNEILIKLHKREDCILTRFDAVQSSVIQIILYKSMFTRNLDSHQLDENRPCCFGSYLLGWFLQSKFCAFLSCKFPNRSICIIPHFQCFLLSFSYGIWQVVQHNNKTITPIRLIR